MIPFLYFVYFCTFSVFIVYFSCSFELVLFSYLSSTIIVLFLCALGKKYKYVSSTKKALSCTFFLLCTIIVLFPCALVKKYKNVSSTKKALSCTFFLLQYYNCTFSCLNTLFILIGYFNCTFIKNKKSIKYTLLFYYFVKKV